MASNESNGASTAQQAEANGAPNNSSSVDINREQANAKPFSWLEPHPIFVIILVGAEEQPFGIQKDFLCAKSSHYRSYFKENGQTESIEHIVKLPSTSVEVFAFAQNFLYTGHVFAHLDEMPPYDVLIGVWKLGHELGIDGLCDRTLDAMAECRRATNNIPATPLLVQVWHDTPEGSSIRKLLLNWAAEYMRSSSDRENFARSLPQEVLSELVVAMSSLDSPPLVQVAGGQPLVGAPRKSVHYLETEGPDASGPTWKKQRHSDVGVNGLENLNFPKLAKKPARTSLPAKTTTKRRSNAAFAGDQHFSTAQKLNFCSDLLTRMLSGPGFWTRLVGPFKEAVDPVTDGVPDYHEKVKKPMDLGSMKLKMDAGQYTDEVEFIGDMRQIFTNCYTYWNKKDGMWAACERLEKTFEEKYSQMPKWIAKMEGDEGA